MSTNDIHGIEDGWSVKTADGHDIGSVEETTHAYILVKSGLVNATHRYLPTGTLEHVRPDRHEIGIGLTNEEVERGDWSQPPTQPPRTEGAPLNEGETEDIDPVAAGRPREPERPTTF